MGALSEEERRALRGSKFAPLPSRPSPSLPHPRRAHPGGSLTTNKAAALAKFLERKLEKPGGLDSINPDLLDLAVQNAKHTVLASGTSNSRVRHVASFGNSEDASGDEITNGSDLEKQKKEKRKKKQKNKKKKKKKKKKKGNKMEKMDYHGEAAVKVTKKMKL